MLTIFIKTPNAINGFVILGRQMTTIASIVNDEALIILIITDVNKDMEKKMMSSFTPDMEN